MHRSGLCSYSIIGGRVSRRAVWIFNHYAITPDLPGGARHYELARRLTQKGFDVSIITSAFHHATHASVRSFRNSYRIEVTDGVRFVWLRSRTAYSGNGFARMLNMVEFALQSWRLGRKQFGRSVPTPDLILGSSPDLLAATAARVLSQHFAVPYVLEIRDLWPESLVEIGGFRASHPLVRLLEIAEKSLYRHADRIISLMPEAWMRIEEFGVPRDKVTWISNGASSSAFADTPGVAARGDRFRLLYLGAHGRANVLDDLLTAAKLIAADHPQVEIALVGDGTEKKRLESRVATENITNIVLEPSVPSCEVPEVLAEADAAVVLLEDSPLYRYGISLRKLFDYMAAGKPVLLAGRVAHDYVALAGCGVTVAPRSPEAIADGIRSLADMSPIERTNMGLKGREYLRMNHDWNVLGDRLARLLEQVLADAAHRQS